MKQLRPHPIRLGAALVAAGLAVNVAEARNVRLMESVPDAARNTRVHEILGDLTVQFGGDSARGADIVRRDVVVKGVGSTRIADVGDDDKVRPSDHDLCARAFEDAITQFAFAARGIRAGAVVGVISNYEGTTFDDPTHYECHAGALKAAVTLRGQLARALPVPPAAAMAPGAPVVSPTPAADVPVVSPPPTTFQPLPPQPAPAPN